MTNDPLEQGHQLVASIERHAGPIRARIFLWILVGGLSAVSVWSIFHYFVFPVLRGSVKIVNYIGGLHLSFPALSSLHAENIATYATIVLLGAYIGWLQYGRWRYDRLVGVEAKKLAKSTAELNESTEVLKGHVDHMKVIRAGLRYYISLSKYYENLIKDSGFAHLIDDGNKPEMPEEVKALTQAHAPAKSELQ